MNTQEIKNTIEILERECSRSMTFKVFCDHECLAVLTCHPNRVYELVDGLRLVYGDDVDVVGNNIILKKDV